MINGNDILDNVVIKDKRDISMILKDIKRLVLLEKLDNDKECILKYIKKQLLQAQEKNFTQKICMDFS